MDDHMSSFSDSLEEAADIAEAGRSLKPPERAMTDSR